MTNEVKIVLESIHLIILVAGFLVAVGIQIGIILYWKHTTSVKLKAHEERIGKLEEHDRKEGLVLTRIDYNLRNLFKQHQIDYIDVKDINED